MLNEEKLYIGRSVGRVLRLFEDKKNGIGFFIAREIIEIGIRMIGEIDVVGEVSRGIREDNGD